MVCAANMNRSMEAHKVALHAGLDVKSYGAGSRVKLPGASRDNPNVFEFGRVTYQEIYDKLMAEDPKLYTRNGLKDMLETQRGDQTGAAAVAGQRGGRRRRRVLRGEGVRQRGGGSERAGAVDRGSRCW